MADVQETTPTEVVTPAATIQDKIYPEKTETPPVEPVKTEGEATDKATEDLKEIALPAETMLSDNDLTSVKAYAKEHGLTNKQAQALIETENERLNAFVKTQVDGFKTKIAGYESAAKSDKEIGGTNYNKSVSLANRTLERFGNDALIQELDNSGLRNHPEVVRLLAKIGSAMGDDRIVAPTAKPVTQQKSMADKFYGSN